MFGQKNKKVNNETENSRRGQFSSGAKYISLSQASELCEYSQEYLSLRARQGKLKAVKLGRNWYTTEVWLKEYILKIEQYKANRTAPKTLAEKNIARAQKIEPSLPGIEADQGLFFKVNQILGDRALAFAAVLVAVMMSTFLIMGWRENIEGALRSAVKGMDRMVEEVEKVAAVIENQINDFSESASKTISTVQKKINSFYKSFSSGVLELEDIFQAHREEAFISFSFLDTVPRRFLEGVKFTFEEGRAQLGFLYDFAFALKSKEVWENTLGAFSEYGLFLTQKASKEAEKIRLTLQELGEFAEQFRNTGEGFLASWHGAKESGANLLDIFKTALREAWQEIKNTYLTVKNSVIAFFERAKGQEVVQKMPESAGKGVVVVPSQTQDLEAVKEKIKESFSDEVLIEARGEDYGVIKPIFRNRIGEEYLYIMVPLQGI